MALNSSPPIRRKTSSDRNWPITKCAIYSRILSPAIEEEWWKERKMAYMTLLFIVEISKTKTTK